jgi:hypothetical protein
MWSNKMVEVAFTHDFYLNIDEQVYAVPLKKAAAMMLSAKGFAEFRPHRNMTESPYVKRTSVRASLADWAIFTQQRKFRKLKAEFSSYVIKINYRLLDSFPITPDPIRP